MRLPFATAAALCLTFAAFAAAQAPPAAPAKRPMTFADLMAMKHISDPQISPSGKWVMFSVTDVSLEKNTKVNHLWVVPLAGGPERQVTSNTGESFGRFSPNGQFVSYTGAPTKDDPVARITIAVWDEATGTIGVGRTLQAVSGDADGAIWSPDSKHFLFTTQVYPECSNKATWVEEDACDKAKEDAADKNPVKAQIWDHLLYRHWNAFTGEKRTHILEADFSLDGANPRDLTPASAVGDAETPTFSLGGPLGYAWAPDSKEIAYVTNLDAVPSASTNNDVFTLRLDEPGAKAVKVSTSPGSDDGPQYSPDGRFLAFRSQARNGYESDQFRLMVFERRTEVIQQMTPKFRNPRGMPYDGWIDEFVWSGDSGAVIFTSSWHGLEAIFSCAAIFSDSPKVNPVFLQMTDSGEYGDLQAITTKDGSDTTIVATKMSVGQPSEVVSLHAKMLGHSFYDTIYLGDHEPEIEPSILRDEVLSHRNDSTVQQLDLSKLESFTFPADDGTRVQGFLIRPPNFDPTKKYPLKFLIHGGPQGAWGDSWSYRWNAELMAASGYVVVMINPRGSTGYGQKFVEGVSGDWGGKAYTDLMRGLDAAEAKYPFIDKTRECALGASYGGYMADWVLTHTNRFKCIVTHDGMYDAESAYGSTEEMWFNEWEFRRAEDFPGGAGPSGPTSQKRDVGHPGKTNTEILTEGQNDGSGDEGKPAQPWRYSSLPAAQDPFRKFSPMRYVQNAKTPTLVIHSQRDYRLDVSQGFELFTALQRRGVPSRFLYFPDEGHWVLKPKNSELWYQTVGEWCDRWTGKAGSRE